MCEMLTLMYIEHTSTMSPVNEIQDYHYYHQVKGITIKFGALEMMCIELRA